MGSHKLGEADRVVSLFTEVKGRVPTVVKGVRKTKSRFGGRLEPLTLLAVRLHEGRNLHTLTAADTISTNAAIRDEPAALQAGLSVVDLLVRSTTEFERRPRTWNMMRRFLPLMSGVAERKDKDGIIRLALAAQLKLLLLAGFLPHLASCAICGVAGTALPRFSAPAGGALCPDCPGYAFAVHPESLAAMHYLLEHQLSDCADLSLSERQIREIWQSLREICRHHIGTNLKVEPWL